MDREILFRGKLLYDDDWAYGYFVKGGTRNCIVESLASYPKYDIEPHTVGQYTGIKDINGTKIFEGDIVEITCKFKGKVEFENCGVVKYKDSGFIVDIFTDEEAFDFILMQSVCNNEREDSYIVIGNIYDNSELLKGVQENETD